MKTSIILLNRFSFAKILILLILASNMSYGQYDINGDASQDNCNCYTLTPALNTQAGSVWNTNMIDLSNSFDYVFDVFLGCSDGGADGMVFGLQPINTSVGSLGNGMGMGGVAPSIGVFLDTYQNGADGDPSNDHISINSNGDVNHTSPNNLAGPVDISSTATNVEDCTWHTLQIIWTYNNATSQTMDVYFDGVLRVTYTGDLINNVFGGAPNVFWGFTAATGGLNNEHKFCTALNANFGTNIIAQSTCAGDPVAFADSSSSFGSIINWEWDFGDGSPTVSGPNDTTSHIYNNDGNYNAQLIITDNSGCQDTTLIPVIIASPSVTAFADVYSICPGDPVQLDAIVPPVVPQNCQEMASSNGQDDGPTLTTINAFPCASGGTITAIMLDASIYGFSSNCPTWYTYDIIINGTTQFTQQCNQTGLDLTPFLPITSVTLSSNDEDVFSDNITLDLTLNITYISAPEIIYLWTPNGGTLSDDTIANPIATTSSNTIYTVTITDVNNSACQASDTVGITVNNCNICTLTANITGFNNVTCFGTANGSATADGSDPLLTYNYEWNSNPVQNTSTATGLDTGSYFCIVTDIVSGCFDTAFVTITEPTPVLLNIISVSPDTICVNGSSLMTATASGGSGADYVFTWTDPLLNTISNNDTVTVFPTVATTYTVVVVDGNGCSSTLEDTIIYVHPPLGLNASATPTNICPGDQTTLGTTGPYFGNGGPYTFNWDNGLGSGNSHNVSPSSTTTYIVTISDGCSPDVTDNVVVTVDPEPVVSFYGDILSGCENTGLSVNFTNTTNPAMVGTVSWEFHNFITDTNLTNINNVAYNAMGLYDVSLVVTSPAAMGGCVGRADSVSYIEVYNLPIVDFSADPNPASIYDPEVQFTDQSFFNIQNWNWDFGGLGTNILPNPSFIFPADTGTYLVYLTVTDNHGCVNSGSEIITIKGEYNVFLPNAFTPDGDGRNDLFIPKGTGLNDENYSFLIYDRWGTLIFESLSMEIGWDGTFKGKMVPLGTYVWKLSFKDFDNKIHEKIGQVNVIR